MPSVELTAPSYSGNRQPIFISRGGMLGFARLSNQIVSLDGATGTPVELYNSSSRNNPGGIIENISIMPLGTNVATVLRLFFRFASMDIGLWYPFMDVTLPAVAAVANNAKADANYPLFVTLPTLIFPENTRGIRLNPESISIGAGLGVAIASGVIVTLWGGEYK
jgi:hypothetical protein